MLDRARMQQRWSEDPSRRRVPEPGGVVPAPGQDSPTVGAKGHGIHRVLMGQRWPDGFAGCYVPEPSGGCIPGTSVLFLSYGYDGLAIGAEGAGQYCVFMVERLTDE